MEYISSAVHYFQQGGFVMYVLAFCSLFIIATGIERFLYFSKADIGRSFAKNFAAHMAQKQFTEAMQLLEGKEEDLPVILQKALAQHMESREDLSSFLENQTGVSISRFRSHLYSLNVVVTLAPLLGLLGTISGMISSFSVFNVESGQATAITGGVGEALIATAMGLCVAIVALVVHSYFNQRVERILTDMEDCFSEVVSAWSALAKGDNK